MFDNRVPSGVGLHIEESRLWNFIFAFLLSQQAQHWKLKAEFGRAQVQDP